MILIQVAFLLTNKVSDHLRGARSSLRNGIERGLFVCCSDVNHKHSSTCCKVKFNDFFAHLKDDLKIWPLEKIFKNHCIDHYVDVLVNDFHLEAATQSCHKCSRIDDGDVEELGGKVSAASQGICLDCMTDSSQTHGNINADYWERDLSKKWDRSCRVTHGQSTWYHSSQGSHHDRDAHFKRKQKLREAHSPFGLFQLPSCVRNYSLTG